jgi:hypothetical protein
VTTLPSTPRLVLGAALLAGLAAWGVYTQQGLVLSHYDAKAHLVVARRVIDNITPGWKQVGAVWLPLPHLLQLLPTQSDFLYRTGVFGSLLSIASFAIAAWAAARLVLGMTGSAAGAVTAAALLLLNPNLLYLQSTPMTEPLLLATTFIVVLWLWEWVQGEEPGYAPLRLRIALVAAAWTRYEAWLVITAALVMTAIALRQKRLAAPAVLARLLRLAAWPAAALLLFLVNSRLTVGAWFVTGGFYVPDPAYHGQVGRSVVAIWWGTHRLSGYVMETVALLAAVLLVIRIAQRRESVAAALPLTLFCAAALPLYAFHQGHPFRIRYMVPMVAACAVLCGVAVGLWRPTDRRRARLYGPPVLALVLIVSSLIESPPFQGGAPLVEEAQWDLPRSRERVTVTACLTAAYRGDKVMASMGSLAHYMQELSREGLAIADFLNEGNGVIWELAMDTGPAPHAGWMLVEEQAEGGDILAQRLRRDPAFADGMQRVCEGGGVALYRRISGQIERQP